MHIFRALPIVAASYGDNFGVRVVIGHHARTNGNIIEVPNVDISSNPALADVLWGYLSHEAAHVKFTDFQHATHELASMPPVGLYINNLIEDVWIENALIDELPGTRQTMDATLEHLVSDSDKEKSDDPIQLFCSYLWNWLRCEYRDQPILSAEMKSLKKDFEAIFPQECSKELHRLIKRKMPKVNSTAKAMSLTREILKLLKQHAQEQDDSQDQGDNQDQDGSPEKSDEQTGKGPGEKSESGEDGNGQSQDDPNQNSSDKDAQGNNEEVNQGNGSGNSADQEEKAGDGETPINISLDSSDSEEQDGESSSVTIQAGSGHKTLKQVLTALESQLGEGLGEMLQAILEQNAVALDLPMMSCDSSLHPQRNESALKGGILRATKLRARLTGLVQAQQMCRSYNTSRGHRINTRRLSRLSGGDMRVFSQESQGRNVNTDVCLLLDSSGSMQSYNRIELCREACASLALALGEIRGVDICAGTFPGYESSVSPICPLGSPVRKHLSRFVVHADGGTPMDHALLWATKELSKGRRDKKLVIVLTDGEPNDHCEVHRLVKRMELSGIELIGVGIQTAAVTRYFVRNVVINNLDDLGPKLFEIARAAV